MATSQITAELFRSLGDIADDDTLMAKVLKYVKKLATQRKQADPTLMSREEFYARVDKAKEGPSFKMLPNEDLTTFLRRIGHDV
ncbi:MAG: hypothetical protein IJ607_05290 [Bacteroidaceae bacterium]|nr:hypothetical protein [Bacteroidaceae bacterium]